MCNRFNHKLKSVVQEVPMLYQTNISEEKWIKFDNFHKPLFNNIPSLDLNIDFVPAIGKVWYESQLGNVFKYGMRTS